MKSNSEISYGARIGNAEKLVTTLASFPGYLPQKPEFSIQNLRSLIDALKKQNDNMASKKQSYSLAVENRKKHFDKDNISIKKVISPINGTVKASFGKTAKEATDVASIIAKIRGANIKSSKKTDEKTVSQSFQSFSSKTQFFADLVVYLQNFGTDYNPSNVNVQLDTLNTLLTNATSANNKVMDSFSVFRQNNTIRLNDYYNLSQLAIRIKDNIKSQYGNKSSEYILVKSLKI
jgi:hypothetical protein